MFQGKTKMLKNMGLVLFFCFCCVIGIYKLDGIYYRIAGIKNAVSRYLESKDMHEKLVDLSEYIPLHDEENAWYTKYHFISHAGGGSRWKDLYKQRSGMGIIL